MTKKIISIILTAAMLLTFAPTLIAAQPGTDSEIHANGGENGIFTENYVNGEYSYANIGGDNNANGTNNGATSDGNGIDNVKKILTSSMPGYFNKNRCYG